MGPDRSAVVRLRRPCCLTLRTTSRHLCSTSYIFPPDPHLHGIEGVKLAHFCAGAVNYPQHSRGAVFLWCSHSSSGLRWKCAMLWVGPSQSQFRAWPRLPQRGARGVSEGRGGLRSIWPVAKAVYSSALENFGRKGKFRRSMRENTNLDDKVSTYCIHW